MSEIIHNAVSCKLSWIERPENKDIIQAIQTDRTITRLIWNRQVRKLEEDMEEMNKKLNALYERLK
jgi:hypothetical protein